MLFFSVAYEMCIIIKRRIRASLFNTFLLTRFKSIGSHPKIIGSKRILHGHNVSMGDLCWIEAVIRYNKKRYKPVLSIGSNVALSDFVHISCVKSISIGEGTLIGSKVYIGDHSHGSYKRKLSIEELNTLPSNRDLGDVSPIKIGKNCWIGDNVVILAGSQIGNGCVIAANSVVKGKFPDYCTIAGVPAKKIKELKEC